MGIKGLWPVLGEGEVTDIADFATKWFEEKNRRFRIAVDAPHWLFRNVSDEKVKEIRDRECSPQLLDRIQR